MSFRYGDAIIGIIDISELPVAAGYQIVHYIVEIHESRKTPQQRNKIAYSLVEEQSDETKRTYLVSPESAKQQQKYGKQLRLRNLRARMGELKRFVG